MAALKKLNGEQIEKIKTSLINASVYLHKKDANPFADSMKVGYAQATLEHLLKQLNGEWPL